MGGILKFLPLFFVLGFFNPAKALLHFDGTSQTWNKASGVSSGYFATEEQPSKLPAGSGELVLSPYTMLSYAKQESIHHIQLTLGSYLFCSTSKLSRIPLPTLMQGSLVVPHKSCIQAFSFNKGHYISVRSGRAYVDSPMISADESTLTPGSIYQWTELGLKIAKSQELILHKSNVVMGNQGYFLTWFPTNEETQLILKDEATGSSSSFETIGNSVYISRAQFENIAWKLVTDTTEASGTFFLKPPVTPPQSTTGYWVLISTLALSLLYFIAREIPLGRTKRPLEKGLAVQESVKKSVVLEKGPKTMTTNTTVKIPLKQIAPVEKPLKDKLIEGLNPGYEFIEDNVSAAQPETLLNNIGTIKTPPVAFIPVNELNSPSQSLFKVEKLLKDIVPPRSKTLVLSNVPSEEKSLSYCLEKSLPVKNTIIANIIEECDWVPSTGLDHRNQLAKLVDIMKNYERVYVLDQSENKKRWLQYFSLNKSHSTDSTQEQLFLA